MKDYTEVWQLQDAITTAVNACGYGVWDLHQTHTGFLLELAEHLNDEAMANFICQLPLVADYDGEGSHGTIISIHNY